MSVNEMTTQNIRQHHFFRAGGGGVFWNKVAHKDGGNSNIFEFDENYRFFTTSSDPYMGHTLHKNYRKDGFYEECLK
jgi:hypothetical protein